MMKNSHIKDSKGLRFLYHTLPGRALLKGLTHPSLSKACGRYLDSKHSKWLIDPFIRKNRIDLSDYESIDYGCFNDCFCRRILSEKRPIDAEPSHLIAPCDGLLSVYHIRQGMVLPVKQSAYAVPRLLADHQLAKKFDDGLCLVFRLCVDHYHRYCFPDAGKVLSQKKISGKLHTVRPIALAQRPVFLENSRVYTVMETENFGTMVQMEIGALLVGRIVNEPVYRTFSRGQEKGHFEYGGSTIIMLLPKDRVQLNDRIDAMIDTGTELSVKIGECIGISKMSKEKHCKNKSVHDRIGTTNDVVNNEEALKVIKGYEINLPVAEVQALVEKALAGDGVKLPVFNEFAHTANAVFPEVGYAWISWKAKGDNTSAVSIQAPKEVDVENAYALFFKSQKTEIIPEEKTEVKVEPIPEEKTEVEAEPVQETKVVEEKKPEKKAKSKSVKKNAKKEKKEKTDNGALSIDELGLRGKAAKDFAEGSGCKTLGDVAKLSREDLAAIPGVGEKTIEKIVKEMKTFGFKLK